MHVLQEIDARLVDAAGLIADQVAGRHQEGKLLGDRESSGDLTDYYRIRFDLPDQWPQRFRLIYDKPTQDTIRVIAVGERLGRAVYREASERAQAERSAD